MPPIVFFAGDEQTAGHHAAPLADQFDVRILPPEQIVAEARPADVAVFFTEHFDKFRQACLDLKEANVATLYMIDGILEWRNAWQNSNDEVACPFTMRPALAHKVACIGAAQARTLAQWGNADKIEVVGIPRLESLSESPTERNDDRFRILVMTAKTPAFTKDQMDLVKRSLRDLTEWAKDNQTLGSRSIEWVWRLTAGLDQELDVSNELADFQGVDLHGVLQRVDAVISTPSTAVLEAMRMELPVAQLDYHNCPHYLQSGWDIATAENIGPAIRSMAKRDAVRMRFQSEQLADSLYSETSSTSRIAELILKMSEIAGQQVQTGQSISFASNLLPLPNAGLLPFDHKAIFANVEFDQQDKSVLQAQLAHSRREIEHLHREIQQLQNELGQAHQIFETINAHPIAGPVVRIRQKMIDLMAKIRSRERAAERGDTKSIVTGTSPNTKSQE